MHTKTQEQLMAFAGIAQVAYQIYQLAYYGKSKSELLQTSLNSVFVEGCAETIEVFGSLTQLDVGLQICETLLRVPEQLHREIPRYLFALLHLERQIHVHQTTLFPILKQRLQKAQKQLEYLPLLHDNIIAHLANIYKDTLSHSNFRIQIIGEATYLNQTTVMHQMRALLLAGVRSAVLWRQLGGKRWHLWLYRQSLIKHLRALRVEEHLIL